MLLLSEDARADLERWARVGYPEETCGVLVGVLVDGVVRVERALTVRNAAGERSRERYELDPGDFVAADAAARALGRTVVGVWHSHPDRTAEPSEIDRASAWKEWSYVILSVDSRCVREVRSWRLEGDRFREEPVGNRR